MNKAFYKENAEWHLKMADRDLASAVRGYEQSMLNLARGQLVKNDKLEKIKEKLIANANDLKEEIHAITNKNQ